MATMEQVFSGYHRRQSILEQEQATGKNPYSRGIAWIEGEYVPLHQARIPLLDQGFMHSDLTYDVPSVWDGRYFRLDDHLTRLENSCVKMRLRFPIPREDIRNILIDMVTKSGIRDAFVEIIVTRGLKGVRGSYKDEALQNNLYMFVQPYVWVMDPDIQPKGGKAVVARTVRRIPPGSIDPTVKNLQWGDLTRGLFEALDRDADYPFLTDGDANLTEGSGFNVVLVKDGMLHTPNRGVLQGISRKSVFDVAEMLKIPVTCDFIPIEMTYQADEIFMCTTAGGIMPISHLDGQPIKDGKVGPITKKIWDGYWGIHYDDRFSFEVQYSKASQISANSDGLQQTKAQL